jgi:hypothetical protein
MDLWLVILIVAIAVASRPVVGRLWHAGRLSDRRMAWILVARFPVLVGIFAVLSGASWQVIVFAVALSLISGLVMYQFMQGLAKDKAGRSADRA